MPLALFPALAGLPPLTTARSKPPEPSPEDAEGFTGLLDAEQDHDKEKEEEPDIPPFAPSLPPQERISSAGSAPTATGQIAPLTANTAKTVPPEVPPDPPQSDTRQPDAPTIAESTEGPTLRTPASHESAFLLRLAEERLGNAISSGPDVASDPPAETPMAQGSAAAGAGMLAGQGNLATGHHHGSVTKGREAEGEADAAPDDPAFAPPLTDPNPASEPAKPPAIAAMALSAPSGEVPAPRSAPPEATLRPAAPPQQIAQAILTAPASGQIALTLAPAELGQVRFGLRRQGERLHVTLLAERPETLDLLRRNLPDLVQELKAAGYDGANFDFEGWQDNPRSPRPPAPFALLTEDGDRAEPRRQIPPTISRPTGQLDLRV